jgi:2-keto-4-pentenoate hydratase/2-oxohepta-3-ene-1,7-dioic acid hydratase in catechol pathway
MKLVTFVGDGGDDRLGVLVHGGERAVDCAAADPDNPALASMQGLMEAGDAGLDRVREIVAAGGPSIPLEEVRLRAPVPVPAQMRDCLSFEAHLKGAFAVARKMAIAGAPDPDVRRREIEQRGEFEVPDVWYRQPIYYKANRFACIGTGEDVQWPLYSNLLDYELEFGCWIGRRGRDLDSDDAGSHIFGYSVLNDVSARDAQVLEMPGMLGPAKGKDFDTSNVIGPCIVTADELDPYDLTMVARVNGEEWSRGSTSSMHWRFEEILAHVSASETVHPGEFIGSGTVGGGCGLELERFLQPSDVVELEVEGIGVLRNRLVKA